MKSIKTFSLALAFVGVVSGDQVNHIRGRRLWLQPCLKNCKMTIPNDGMTLEKCKEICDVSLIT